MAIEKGPVVWNDCKIFTKFSVLLAIFMYHSFSFASDWKIIPSVTLSESYSDNINLEPSGSEKGAFVTELSPGISIRRETGRGSFNWDYRMQNLQNSGGNNKLETFSQLQSDSNLEIFRNSLFLDLNSSISQQNATNINTANNNSSGSENRTNVSSYGISPYWTPHLNGYADGEVRFNYQKLMTDNSGASNSENFDYSVRLDSGRRFSRVTWFVDYDKRDQIRENGDDVKFQETLVELRGHINRHFNVFTQLGYSKNSFQSTTNQNSNGFSYNIGARWKPSERLSLEAAIGNNSFVTVELMPTRHMHWITTYGKNDIGTNTNEVWETSFDFETKRSIWRASYQEDTTTIQSELLNTQSFTLTDEFGDLVIDPVTQQPVQFDIRLPTLGNEVIFTQNGEVSVSYRTGKSDVSVRLFNNKTTMQVSQTISDVMGISGSWDWRFVGRTTFFIRPAWQQTIRDDSTDNRSDIALGINRRIPTSLGGRAQLNANIEYRYVNQTSDIDTNEFTENRIVANLSLNY